MTTTQERLTLQQGAPPDAEALLAAMLRIRLFEDEIMGLFTKQLVRGSTHLCQGQEAVTVGVASSLRDGDTVVCTYRGHGAVLAMGAELDASFAEIMGRSGGLCKGRGGSMHLTDVARGVLGSNAIVGGHLPIAVGAALSAQHLGTGAVSVAFFGDGATNIGAFHESLNMAGIWKLPVLFVIENNQYGEYSPIASTTPIARLADRAASYGMPGVQVDGNDVVAVREAAREAVDRATGGEGPTLLEALTYRHGGHSRADPGAYRPPGELDSWLERDPITALERAMRAGGGDAETRIEQVREAVTTDVAEALKRALSWPEPDAEERFEDVYA